MHMSSKKMLINASTKDIAELIYQMQCLTGAGAKYFNEQA